MQLIFRILPIEQKEKAPVEVILEAEGRAYKKKVHPAPFFKRCRVKSADKILEGLDKILKRSKIEITDIKSIKIDNQNKNRHTSYRIAEAILRALRIILALSK